MTWWKETNLFPPGGGGRENGQYPGQGPGDIPAWEPRFEYDEGIEVLAPDGSYYRCLVDHTASDDFNADIANWELFGGAGAADTNDQLLTKVGDNIVLSGGTVGGVPIPDSTVDMNDFAYLWNICGLPLLEPAPTDTFVFCRWNGSSFDKYNGLISDITAVENLQETLAEGNFSGAHDIIMSTETGDRYIWSNNATTNNRFFVRFSDGGVGADAISMLRLGAGIANSSGFLFLEEGLASIGYTQPGEGPDIHSLTLDDVGYKRFHFTSSGGTSYIDIDSSVQLRFEQNGFFGILDPTNLTGNKLWTLPDQTGTIALLSDIPAAESLQATLAVGNSTGPNDIIISQNQVIRFINGVSGTGSLKSTVLTTPRTWTLPDKSGTIALTSDITTALFGYVQGSGGQFQVATFTGVGNSIAGDPDFTWDGNTMKINTADTTPIEYILSAAGGMSLNRESFSQFIQNTWSNSNTYPIHQLSRYRGTADAILPPNSGDRLGEMRWSSNAAGLQASIAAYCTENHVASGVGGTRLVITTVANGETITRDRIEIQGDGSIKFHGLGAGGDYVFPTAQATSAGQVLTDVAGNGILTWETPATYGTGQTYTETNVTTDRSYDANSTSLDELADVVGTLLSDLRSVNIIA